MKHFENLSEQEYTILKETLPKIGALIANADGTVDIDEVYWAEKITHIRTYADPHELNAFYDDLEKDFKERFENEVAALPVDKDESVSCLSKDIARVNDVLPKLSPKIAYLIYASYTSFAKHIAKASGGILGFFSVGSEEAKLIDLPMINPIDKPAETETAESEGDEA